MFLECPISTLEPISAALPSARTHYFIFSDQNFSQFPFFELKKWVFIRLGHLGSYTIKKKGPNRKKYIHRARRNVPATGISVGCLSLAVQHNLVLSVGFQLNPNTECSCS